MVDYELKNYVADLYRIILYYVEREDDILKPIGHFPRIDVVQ